jgi:hypothetical protein
MIISRNKAKAVARAVGAWVAGGIACFIIIVIAMFLEDIGRSMAILGGLW